MTELRVMGTPGMPDEDLGQDSRASDEAVFYSSEYSPRRFVLNRWIRRHPSFRHAAIEPEHEHHGRQS